jgi:hypothetical protein
MGWLGCIICKTVVGGLLWEQMQVGRQGWIRAGAMQQREEVAVAEEMLGEWGTMATTSRMA